METFQKQSTPPRSGVTWARGTATYSPTDATGTVFSMDTNEYGGAVLTPHTPLTGPMSLPPHSEIQDGVTLHHSMSLGPHSSVGDKCTFWGDLTLGGYCRIGEDVAVAGRLDSGPHCRFGDKFAMGERSRVDRHNSFGDGATFGAHTRALRGLCLSKMARLHHHCSFESLRVGAGFTAGEHCVFQSVSTYMSYFDEGRFARGCKLLGRLVLHPLTTTTCGLHRNLADCLAARCGLVLTVGKGARWPDGTRIVPWLRKPVGGTPPAAPQVWPDFSIIPPRTHIPPGSTLGHDCYVGADSEIGAHSVAGDRLVCLERCQINGGFRCGDSPVFGEDTTLNGRKVSDSILVGPGATFGPRCTLIGPMVVGGGCRIGEGAKLTRRMLFNAPLIFEGISTIGKDVSILREGEMLDVSPIWPTKGVTFLPPQNEASGM